MLEKIYTQITEEVLPKISDGLIITKDYFFDLFGRYVKYLIIIDSISLLFFILLLITIFFIFKKYKSKIKEIFLEDEIAMYFLLFFMILALIFPLCFSVNNLIKDLTIPEIRVYEEILKFKN